MLADHQLVCLQHELVPTCRELGIGILAYSPMGRGVLTGQFKPEELPEDDVRNNRPGCYFSRETAESVRQKTLSESNKHGHTSHMLHMAAACRQYWHADYIA